MKIYALDYWMGISSGERKLIGFFESEEKAKAVEERLSKEKPYTKNHYSIIEIELNKEIDYVYAEW